jgi:hypothetical protein
MEQGLSRRAASVLVRRDCRDADDILGLELDKWSASSKLRPGDEA